MQTVTVDKLADLLAKQHNISITAIARGRSFLVKILSCNNDELVIAKARTKEPRLFRSTNEIFNLLKKLGINTISFTIENFDPNEQRVLRPDSAVNLKQAHEAKIYDEWFRNEVQKGLTDAELFSSHEVKTYITSSLATLNSKNR